MKYLNKCDRKYAVAKYHATENTVIGHQARTEHIKSYMICNETLYLLLSLVIPVQYLNCS